MSLTSNGVQGNGHSHFPSISADGRFVAFDSTAPDLVPGDTNNSDDVFVRDRQTGVIERVSVSSSGMQGYGVAASISADGRYVAFHSSSGLLVPGDTTPYTDIFVRDRQTGITELVSRDSNGAQGNSHSYRPSISNDGRFVAFHSAASNLDDSDTNGAMDVFVCDLLDGSIRRVSVSSLSLEANGNSQNASISADGRHVAFDSWASNLVPGDTSPYRDVFVHDSLTGSTERVSVHSSGAQGNGNSEEPAISGDGGYVAFHSVAATLVDGDSNSSRDVFVHDRLTATTSLASTHSSGAQANGTSELPSISADGRYIAFRSFATNLVDGDTNGPFFDIFLRDQQAGVTERINVGSNGAQANANSSFSSFAVSSDGRYVAFGSQASNFVPGDTNGTGDVFVRDREAPLMSFCFGDGSSVSCPCGNSGNASNGCENSASAGGAILTAAGSSSLAGDTFAVTSSGELPTALSIVLQGDAQIAATSFGDGLRCVGGSLKRLYVKSAVLGTVTAPAGGDPSVSARSAALGDVIPAGASRFYQTYYRDPDLSFCPSPQGNTWNASSALAVVWAD